MLTFNAAAGTVEVQTLRPLWIGGAVVDVGTVAPMPRADAVYLAGLGRVAILPPPADPPADDLIGETKPAKGKRGA